MSKRIEAKKLVLDYLTEHQIESPYYLKYSERVYDVHEILEEFGYKHAGTRRCIINEVFRDTGQAPKRDSFRRKTYRFEDNILLGSMMGTDIVEPLEEVTLKRILAEMSCCLEIPTPKLVFDDKAKCSFARGQMLITLAKSQRNLFVLIHELSHIYGNVTGDYTGHDAKFLATEMALLDLYRYNTLEAMFRLARVSHVKVDEEYGERVQRHLVGSTDGEADS